MTMPLNQTTGVWVPLMEYAVRRRVSVSTLRRHIKTNKVKFRIEDGRYLIWDETGLFEPHFDEGTAQWRDLQIAYQKVSEDLTRAREEIAELKTLIAFYEEKVPPTQRFHD